MMMTTMIMIPLFVIPLLSPLAILRQGAVLVDGAPSKLLSKSGQDDYFTVEL